MLLALSGGRIRGAALLAVIAFGLTGCGGGGGNGGTATTTTPSSPLPPSPQQFSLSTNSLSYVAKERFAAPQAQYVTATVNTTTSGTLYILVKVAGQAVESVAGFGVASSTSGTGTVYAQDPATLQPGTYQGTITVTACMNSPDCSSGQLTGSPQTINVTYTVQAGTVQGQLVMPQVAVSNTTGDVIIRGANFTGATSVSFGSTSAAAFSVLSDTEIHATYPPLVAGSYPVTINSGAVAFSASLAVVDPQEYSATALAYPSPAPAALAGMVGTPKYDAVRKTIYVVLRSSQQDNRLVSYTYSNGAWGAPQQATITNLRDVILGPTGAYLLGYAGTSILQIDPTTLAVQNTYTVTDALNLPSVLEAFIDGLALTNDGYAIVTFSCGCSGMLPIYLFSTQDHSFQVVQPDATLLPYQLEADGRLDPVATTSTDGATALLGTQYAYQPSTSVASNLTFTHGLQAGNVPPPIAMDNKGTRLSLSGVNQNSNIISNSTEVYDGQFQLLGIIAGPPTGTTGDLLSAVSPDGTRDYVLQYDFSQNAVDALLTYDISSSTPVASFPQLGSTVSLSPMTIGFFSAPVATVTSDGQTLLVGADNGLFVQPLQ